MADSIVGGLFGMTPEMYQQQQNQQALAQSAELGQLDPFSAARTGLIYGGRQLAGVLGGQDPMLQLLSKRNAVLKNVDQNDVVAKYTLKGAKLDSQEFSSDIGSNKTVALTFTAQVGGPQDTARGLFISGQF